MKKITITVDVDGEAISREYVENDHTDLEDWGTHIVDMLDTLAKSNEKEF